MGLSATRPPVPGGAAVPRLSDPDAVREIFANDVFVQMRDGVVQLTFCATRAVGCDARGATTFARVVTGRVAVPLPVVAAMIGCFQNVADAVQLDQVQPRGEGGPEKQN